MGLLDTRRFLTYDVAFPWQTGHALNHDELVVYKEEAALPTHLIVYAIS